MIQNKITQYQAPAQKRFNYKRIIFLFIAAIFLSLFLYSVKAHSLEFETSIPDKVTLYKEPVDVWFSIKNTSDSSNLYTFKLYTSPFSSRVDIQSIRINERETKQIKFTIYPIENTTSQEYTSTLEISENQLIHFYSFKIVQLINKTCEVDLNYAVNYLIDSNRFHLDLNLTNKSNTYNTLTLNRFEDLNSDQFNEMSVGLYPYESKTVNYYFDTNKPNLTISYVCNGLFLTKEIDFPEKPINNNLPNNGLGLSGYFTYTNFKEIINSLLFQIILVIVIILLTLSFASRYIRLIHLHNMRRKL